MLTFLLVINIAGTAAFAVSGALLAAKKKMDWVGFVFIGNVTGIGGGTLRDVILDVPVFWLVDWYYVVICSVFAVITYFATQQISRKSNALLWADAVGMALFSVLGAEKALSLGAEIPVAVIMGVFSACLGGIIRDVILNDVPVVFQKEIYITASLCGAIAYCICFNLLGIIGFYAIGLGCVVAFTVRAIAIVTKLSMPAHKGLH
ncbi:MAG: putative membrane protein YeiH [Glaciecola sp.]|jgi:uncharacterized membrane protein YeiH